MIDLLGKSPRRAGYYLVFVFVFFVFCFFFFFNIWLHPEPSLHTDVGSCVSVPLSDYLVLDNMGLFESLPDDHVVRSLVWDAIR